VRIIGAEAYGSVHAVAAMELLVMDRSSGGKHQVKLPTSISTRSG